MKIAKDHVVEMDYTLTNNSGQVLDTSEGRQPLAYLHGARNIIPGLEKELEGLGVGDSRQVTVSPEEGYGLKNDDLISEVPKADLASLPDLQVGMQIQGQSEQGVQIFTILSIEDETVTLDGNHPLAGETLNFDVKIVNIRAPYV